MNVFNYWKKCYNFKNPLNWWRLPRYWFKSLKYAYQRATKGYCDWDIWNLHNFYLKLFYHTLAKFADERYGSPDEDHEKWTRIYREIALNFRSALEEKGVYRNEFEEEYFKAIDDFVFEFEKTEDGYYHLICDREEDETVKAAREKYHEREKEIFELRDRDMKKGFDMLKEVFWHLWD